MIHSIYIENYRSFFEPVQFDLKAHGSKLSGDFRKSSNGSTLSNVAAVLGPNGSGKSNLIAAIKEAIRFIFLSLQVPESLMGFRPHRLRMEDPSSFSIEFEINNEVYTYSFRTRKGQLIEEKLSTVYPINRVLFHRKIKDKGLVILKNDILPPEISKSVLPSDISVIAVGERFGIEPLRKIYGYFLHFNFDTRRPVLGRQETRQFLHFALKNYIDNSDYLDRLNHIIERIDLGIQSVKVEEVEEDISFPDRGKKYKMILDHGDFSLDLSQESSGTRCIIYLLSKIFKIIDNGGVLISDELENHFHDDLFQEIVGIFRDPEYNKYGAQLIFSTNSTYALTFLNKYQVYLVEKNNHKSDLYRMSDFSDIRETHNLEKNYRSGKYGAIPNLRNIH